MIISTFKDYKKQFLHPILEKALEEAENLFKTSLPDDGIYNLSNDVKAIVMRYQTKAESDVFYETHDVMTDIQIVLEGEEYIYIRQNDDLTPTNNGEDFQFYAEKPCEYVRAHMKNGNFSIIFPKEAHAPSISVNDSTFIVKMVLKIPL